MDDLFKFDQLTSVVEYKLQNGVVQSAPHEGFPTYGISLWIDGRLYHQVDDVYLEKDTLGQFVDTLNLCKLSPVHLMDAIEDFLCK